MGMWMRLLKYLANRCGLGYQVTHWDSDRWTNPHVTAFVFAASAVEAEKVIQATGKMIADDRRAREQDNTDAA